MIFQAHSLLFTRVTVFVVSDLPRDSPPLYVHCASGDDELGYHTLKLGQDFHFEFGKGPKTLFFCHLWWNGKNIAFDVFRTSWKTNHCASVPEMEICYWQARPDGIYLAKDYPATSLTKQYSW
ncbi:hypothetical protein PHJA_002933400 [Phtheirospermum japonicum]|uniref:S-protein homolog n=1 Tax=Phtheirospermum japonicum TaxID=374723 RepID=A0A830DK16_9LAMI|nr:hypothetical protein PHJA_002933400 [Phtheirospermum japonicum]